jgi:small subunit ribosomal protein S18
MKNIQKVKKECYFKVNNIDYIDYKDIYTLKQYMSSYAKIKSRRRTGTSAKFQRQLDVAIKRARFMGLVPYVNR